MKSIGQLREGYEKLSSKEDADIRHLDALARAGLLESEKVHMFKRVLNADLMEMTIAEKKVLKNLAESLIAHVVSELDEGVKVVTNSDKEVPNIIILRRKSYKIYPEGQKIGLYYSSALDRFVSIPFGPKGQYVAEAAEDEPKPLDPEKSFRKIGVSRKWDTNARLNSALDKNAEQSDTPTRVGVAIGLELRRVAATRKHLKVRAARRAEASAKPVAPRTSVPSVSRAISESFRARLAQKRELDENILAAAGRMVTGAVRKVGGAARTVGGAIVRGVTGGGANGSSSGASTEKKVVGKEVSNYTVGLNSPKGKPVRTAVQARDEAQYRKSMQMREEVLQQIRMVAEGNYNDYVLEIGGDTISINTTIANKILSVHENLNKENKRKMESLLAESTSSFKKLIDFSIR